MERVFIAFSISLFVLFVNGQTDTKEVINLKEVEIEEIIIPIFDLNQIPDTIHVNWKNFHQTDTIKIVGYIADYGEWGGHDEFIKIYRSNNEFIAIFNKDTLEHNRIFEKLKKIGEEDEITCPCACYLNLADTVDINNYKQEFENLAVGSIAFSNAPTHFSFYVNGKEYYRVDPSGSWLGFIRLRDKLFEKVGLE